MAERYTVHFSSTGDRTLDDETARLQREAMTLDDIAAVCANYQVRASVLRDGHVLVEMLPPAVATAMVSGMVHELRH